ncbi:MAG TPA: Hsp20/alpha crystallin family protein [Methylibium sp.]|nr:Hsp20/alpha crystallin family protein [Methylibium sp.]
MFVMPITRGYALNGQQRDLSRAFDRLLDETVDRVFGPTPTTASRLPALDVRETEQAYAVLLDLPGVAKEDVKVTIDGKRVAIEAAPREAVRAEGERVIVRERSAVAYARSFALPVELDEGASQAKLENGVLSLTLAKKVKPASQLTIG